MSVYNEKIKDIEYVINSILEQTYSNIEFIIMYD
ncbi:glycosyltransferase family A protein, partial [Enterococcus faecium]